MSISIRHASAFVAALLACAAAPAQTGSTTAAPAVARPDSLEARAVVAPLVYQSSFARYRRLSDEKLISWREANDAVARIGGWRVYAREAQQAEPAPAASASAPLPKPSMHDGHKMP